MNSAAEGAERRIRNGQKNFPPNTWQMMTLLNPLDALIPKIRFSILADFWVWVTSEARGSVSVGFSGSRQLGGGGGSSQGAQSTPPPEVKARLPQSGFFVFLGS